MKIISFLSLLLCLFGQLQAQNSTSVYFASGSAQLDAQAAQTLSQLATQLKAVSDFEWKIVAYTDDKGSPQANLDLAKRRSDAVKEFLIRQQIRPSSEQIVNSGEISLESDTDPETQRARNRRVDITFTPFAPNNLSDLFGYFQQDDAQQFRFSNLKDKELQAAKGTLLYVPAGIFQTASGDNPDGDVILSIREMYTYGDMIRANLSTHSGGKMLETGGMIYLSAQDAKGNPLDIRPNQELVVSMPTQMENMQLFTANRDQTDPHQTINWTPQGNDFRFNRNPTANTYEVEALLLKDWSPDQTYYYNLDTFVSFPKDAVALPEPLEPKAPEVPANLNTIYTPPSLELTTQNTERKKGEKQKEYEERIQRLYQSRLRKHNENLALQQKNRQQYPLDSAQYAQELADYVVLKKAYDANKNRLFHCYQSFYEDWVSTLSKLQSTVFKGVWVEVEMIWRASRNFQTELSAAVETAKTLQMSQSLKDLQAMPQFSPHFVQQMQTLNSLAATKGKLLKNIDFAVASVLPEMVTKNTNTNTTNAQILNRYYYEYGDQTISTAWNWQDAQHRHNLDTACTVLQQTFANDTLRTLLDLYYSVAAEALAFSRRYTQCTQQLKTLQADIYKERQQRGLLTPQERLQEAGTALGLNRLGWINCDRFYNDLSPKINIEIVTQGNPQNETYFLVFKDIRSVMQSTTNAAKGTAIYSIPAQQSVKLIGLRVANGTTEVFVREGKAGDFQRVRPTFSPTPIADLQTLLKGC